MAILIKGLEMPKDGEMLCINIYPDGKVSINLDLTCAKIAQAVQLPPHGRLVDVDKMERDMSNTVQGDIRGYPYSDTLWDEAFRWIDHQPTIIEAEGVRE